MSVVAPVNVPMPIVIAPPVDAVVRLTPPGVNAELKLAPVLKVCAPLPVELKIIFWMPETPAQ
ncbi:hypothetical protein F6R98_11930 [Candidatus Methylospira mobilis]|uniref:Uncharacterized protein n=1 Tax=Candidatus Methylospira mobilis TaxID=1808979 RepID=A0A5Q0BJD7_9GAMM|nr:hypothetical protein F6R98_11930 [Candidatus Methylospira mobilis]